MARQNPAQKKRNTKEKQSNARKKKVSQTNGRKSSGPKTQQGRDRIAQARTKHGMSVERINPVLLPNEDAAKLNELTLAYYEHIRPANAAEASLVDLLVYSIWRGARLVAYEAELIAGKAEDLQPTLADTYESISSTRLFALAFEAINGRGSANPTLNRYFATTRNAYHSALRDIEHLRKLKGDPQQPYYPPHLAKPVEPLPLTFEDSEPPTVPLEVQYAEAMVQADPAPQPDPPQAIPQPHIPPDLNPVPNPDAPNDPLTVWVHILGDNGKPILDNNDNPILKPVYIGPGKPDKPTIRPTPSQSTAPAESEIACKRHWITKENPIGVGGRPHTGN